MTLNELKVKYHRLSNEIDRLAAAAEPNESRLLRLLNDLDQAHRDLADLRRRTLAAPTLRDVVPWPQAEPAPLLAA